ncbi:hypothetical protein [Rossellomorea aquimaris]|uniref:hypothetical protein n=1 Tax=Rossellomorea aquimaris TaxID=189382 RepID=UPI000B25535A|nr:hypothetical protein [Rossellomorea aquimaris]
MNFFLLFTLGLFFIGLTGLVFIKKKIETVHSILWWITAATAWGMVNIFLVVWSFHTSL